jgi:hypothetical protein
MRILKNEFLISLALFATITTYSDNTLVEDVLLSIHQQKIEGGGTIVMTDIIMAVTVNNPQDPILKILVLNSIKEPIFQEDGCGSYHCSFNLSTFVSGNYTVIVFTEQGDSFSASIQL